MKFGSPCLLTTLLMAASSVNAFTATSSSSSRTAPLYSTFQQLQQQQQQQTLQQQKQRQQPPPRTNVPGGDLAAPSRAPQDLSDGFLKGDADTGRNNDLFDDSQVQLATPDDIEMFPIYPELELIQGGGTVKTYKMPPWAERCQMMFRTTGRPIKAKAELWLGPRRTTHQLHMNVEDGNETPIQATLKFKKAAQVLKITTTGSVEFPVLTGVYVPPPQRAEELRINTERLWEVSGKHKQVIQGGIVQEDGQPGRGAYRYWNIPAHVKSVQILAWSIDTGKKSFKADIEVLQGPNTNKQRYFLQCGGGSQPYHGVFQTPGDACIVGIRNKKFLEDGLTQFAVVPYEVYPYPE